MVHKLLVLLLFSVASFLVKSTVVLEQASQEVLILFNDANTQMTDRHIAKIRTLAEEMHLNFVVKDATDGLPKEVTTLPSIYFQNYKGRSKYYGRYSNTSRLKNFIRISKLAHQKDEVNAKKSVLVWKSGRADVTAPIKITDLSGDIPVDFDQTAFNKNMKKTIAKGMQAFQLLPSHNLTKNTRSFYFNLYPYRSEDDKLFLTAEIFSQYNCVKPTFRQLKPALVQAKWSDREKAFANAAQLIEAEIMRQIKESPVGDAFVPIANTVNETTWETLNLALPEKQQQTNNLADKAVEIPQKWKVEARENTDDPIVIFSFLSPVDNYAGEVQQLSGTLQLGEGASMQGAQGKFEVKIADVTMGAEDFDYEVQNKMLKMGLFPDAHFEFVEVQKVAAPLELGKAQQMLVRGKFTMLGIDTPIDVETTIEPFLDEKEQLKLRANCTFQLPLFEKFKLDGPDGPSPARDILQFYMQFNLIPLS